MNKILLQRICVLLLWFAAMHHCAFEGLISAIFSAQVAHAEENSDPCRAHSSEDAGAHREGQPCGTVLQTAAKAELHNVDLLLVRPAPSFGLHTDVVFFASSATLRRVTTEALPILPTLRRLSHSLSLAPNAPPQTIVSYS